MMFDAEVTVLSATISATTPEALEHGVKPAIEVGIISGTMLPFANPENGQPIILPVGRLSFTFTRKQGIEIFGQALEAAMNLPEETTQSGNVVIAQSMQDVDRTAQALQIPRS